MSIYVILVAMLLMIRGARIDVISCDIIPTHVRPRP
jgi:hypothetical protein